MFIRKSAALLALTVVMPAWAQDFTCPAGAQQLLDDDAIASVGASFSVEQAVSLALKNDLRREVAEADVLIAKSQRSIAKLRPSDELRFQTEDFPRSGQVDDFDTLEITASYARTWERGGKRSARTALAEHGVNVAQAGMAVSENQIAFEVRRLYAAVLVAKARQSIECMEIDHVTEIKSVTKKRVSRSVDPQLAISRISTELMAAHSDLQRYKQLELSLKQQLFEMVGQEFTLDVTPLSADTNIQALDMSFARTPELLLLEAKEQEADGRIALQEANRKADINWSVGVRGYSATDDVGLVTSFSVPLGKNNRGKAEKAKARAEKNAYRARKQALKQRLLREAIAVKQSSVQAVNALNDLNTKILPEATEALELAEKGYSRGALPFRDILEAHEILIGLHKQRVDYLETYLMNDAAIQRLNGNIILMETKNDYL